MKEVARKSQGWIALNFFSIIAIIIMVFVLISNLGNKEDMSEIFIFILIIALIIFIPYVIYLMSLPNVLISYDDTGLIIHKKSKDIHIDFDNIKNVIQRNANGRGIRYSFGKIIIETVDMNYEISCVANVDQVKTNILLLKSKNK